MLRKMLAKPDLKLVLFTILAGLSVSTESPAACYPDEALSLLAPTDFPSEFLPASLAEKVATEGISKADIETAMASIPQRGGYFGNRMAEASHYILAEKYAEYLPTYSSVDDLIRDGIIRAGPDGKYVSDYLMSYTHLGVISPKVGPDGVIELQNRGTSSFRGANDPAFHGNIFGAKAKIKSSRALEIFGRSDLHVIVAVPKDEALRLGIDPYTDEVWIVPEQIAQIKGIRLFRSNLRANMRSRLPR